MSINLFGLAKLFNIMCLFLATPSDIRSVFIYNSDTIPFSSTCVGAQLDITDDGRRFSDTLEVIKY